VGAGIFANTWGDILFDLWYLPFLRSGPDYEAPIKSAFFSGIASILLFNNLIPISLVVTVEATKYLQARAIIADPHLVTMDAKGDSVHPQVLNVSLNESLGLVDCVVTDKTGTLTEGHPRVVEVVPYDMPENEVLRLAASAEFGSEHRLGAAILREAEDRNLQLSKPTDFHSVSGYGVMAIVDGRRVLVGNTRLMRESGHAVDEVAAHEAAQRGLTPVFVLVDYRPAGILGLADTIKPTAQETIDRLKKLGLQVTMLTGDNYTAARTVATQLGIQTVVAEVLPDAKSAMIKGWKKGGGVIGMVGDGINDAPALAEADVGIAMGQGTDIAMDAADVVLIGGDLNGVANAVELSRVTVRNIRQNLFFAFVYNALGIPLAAGVFYPFTKWLLNPMIASAAMALSSLSVLVNALRLRRFGQRK
jgi:Cu+-exporting ATPase